MNETLVQQFEKGADSDLDEFLNMVNFDLPVLLN